MVGIDIHGDPERAEEVFRRLVETPGVSSTAHRNLVETRLSLGKIEEASRALADFEQEYPDHEFLSGRRVRTRVLEGRWTRRKQNHSG